MQPFKDEFDMALELCHKNFTQEYIDREDKESMISIFEKISSLLPQENSYSLNVHDLPYSEYIEYLARRSYLVTAFLEKLSKKHNSNSWKECYIKSKNLYEKILSMNCNLDDLFLP